ncbi:MAG: hypothetical protein WC023_08785 [Rhodocyclaceae bacterium]
MRHYDPDSPEATARIIALTLLADGAIDLSEIESIKRYRIIENLNLSQRLFDEVVHGFCEDVLVVSHRGHSGQIELDRDTVRLLLSDIRSNDLQHKLLRSMLDIVNADTKLSGSEAIAVAEAMKLWDIDLRQVARTDRRSSARVSPVRAVA